MEVAEPGKSSVAVKRCESIDIKDAIIELYENELKNRNGALMVLSMFLKDIG